MYKFNAMPATGGNVAQDVPFQATTLPGWTPELRVLMSTGAQWDNVIGATVDWTIGTSALTRQARLNVNWSVLFEQASSFAAYHRNRCVDTEVRTFFQHVSTCNQENACGVRIEYLQNGTWTETAPADADFINVVNAVQKTLQDELFNEIHLAPTLGQVSDRRTANYTLRANYEKLLRDGNEVVYVQWNPGPSTFSARTELNISCLMGGFEDGLVTWNMDDQACRQMVGQN
jgi:hypothetical protein